MNPCHWHTVCCWTNGIWQQWLWEVISRLFGLCSLHFLMRKWPPSVTILSSQWQGCTTSVSHLTFGLRQLWIWTPSPRKGGCRFCTISNCLQQQWMQKTLQEWRLLCSRTSNASIFICSMLSVSQWGWRRMSKQFMTSRHPCMILMLILLASSLQHLGHCSLDWSPFQDLCVTPRLQ